MIVRPELQALRGNDAPQRQAQAEVGALYQAWCNSNLGRTAEDEVARFEAGAPITELPLLGSLFEGDDLAATDFAAEVVSPFLGQLSKNPLAQVPFRHSVSDGTFTLALIRRGSTVLSLQAFDGIGLARRPFPVSANFTPSETHERVLAGNASALRVTIASHRPDGADLEFAEAELAPGMVSHRFGLRDTQLLRDVEGTLVMLKLQRRTGSGAVSNEHLLADGRLVHRSAGSPRESRLELAAALLGRMGRSDAAPLLAAMAEEEASQSLRWQALRECLGLDTATGFATLCRIAARGEDPLAAPAGALRAQLLETYPQLAGVQPCLT